MIDRNPVMLNGLCKCSVESIRNTLFKSEERRSNLRHGHPFNDMKSILDPFAEHNGLLKQSLRALNTTFMYYSIKAHTVRRYACLTVFLRTIF